MDWSHLHNLVGYKSGHITWWQMTIRGVAIFLYGLLLVRVGGRRIYGRSAPLDIVLAVLIGSNLSRALTGNAPFVPTIAATTGLIFVYWLLAYAAFRFHFVDWLTKGSAQPLVTDGRVDWRRMRRHGITPADLDEAMRKQGITDAAKIKAAYMERDGSIVIITKADS